MRIGTWNLQGRWDERHLRLLDSQACDVWLLTEVNARVDLPGWHETRTDALMAAKRAWAGVFTRSPLRPLPDPHPATAAAVTNDVTFWSSILPWRSAGAKPPWEGARHADWTSSTVGTLMATPTSEPLVWGGDWNHAISGREYTGSVAGRRAVLEASTALDLRIVTGQLGHRLPGLLSIDHIAVPSSWCVNGAWRVVGQAEGARLSDHDMYVVDAGTRLSATPPASTAAGGS